MLRIIIISLVVLLILVNVYFRVKVIGLFKKLNKEGVLFSIQHVLNKEKMQKEILPRYPDRKEEILSLTNYMSNSFKISSLLLLLIAICAVFYMMG